MKRLIRFLWVWLVFGFAISTSTVSAQNTLAIGSDIPMKTRQMMSTQGANTTVASIKGQKGSVVVFWCNTCPWVKRYESRLQAIVSAYKAKGFGFIAVNSNDPVAYPDDSMAEMTVQSTSGKYSFPYVVDQKSELAVAFGAKRTPQVFVFDSADKLIYQGAIDDSPADENKVQEDYLVDALDAIVSGGKVALAETKAFGCTIKFQ